MTAPTPDPVETPALHGLTSAAHSRRRFLIGAGGMAAAGLVVAACGSDDNKS
ncbi:MAG: hypothetical protein JO291_06035, partial [Acidimicrobiia bacterium]|nr:hypothetical protein [Acidimicrobiia bacterium]